MNQNSRHDANQAFLNEQIKYQGTAVDEIGLDTTTPSLVASSVFGSFSPSATSRAGRNLNSMASLLNIGALPGGLMHNGISTAISMPGQKQRHGLHPQTNQDFLTAQLAALRAGQERLSFAQQNLQQLGLPFLSQSNSLWRHQVGGGLLGLSSSRLMGVRSLQADAASLSDAYERGKEEVYRSLLEGPAMESSFASPLRQRQSKFPPTLRMPMQDPSSQVLDELGTTSIERRKINAPYFDASGLKDPDPVSMANRRARGGVSEPFPEKLHRLLADVEKEGKADIIGFLPHGRAFILRDPGRFVSEVMPGYFKQSRLSSFQRQLNLYGFTRITSGPDSGGYYHELFLKGRPALAIHMRRVGVPRDTSEVRSFRPSGLAPDFSHMPPVHETEDERKNSL
jgi:hypothetical protein